MHALLRIMDANANRAREALRTLDDVARFALEREDLCELSKALRHRIGACLRMGGWADSDLVLARDVAGDVGTRIGVPSEAQRASMPDIVHSASGRLGEALRSMEESAKALGAQDAAQALETARYAGYTLHQRFVLAMGGASRRQFRLCVLITESLCTAHSWQRVAELSVQGGADCLQLREKSLTDRELLTRAHTLVAMAAGSGTAVFVNDRPDIALLARAGGVHVGQEDLPAADVRRLIGSSLLLGVSTTTLDQAISAVADGADVCGVGPMYPTTTKHKPHLAGPEYLRTYLATPQTRRVPHLAIGGITSERVPELVQAGCRGVAVSSAVCSASNPQKTCEEVLRALTSTPHPPPLHEPIPAPTP